MKGFSSTGIYPMNSRAMDGKIGPSETYGRGEGNNVVNDNAGYSHSTKAAPRHGLHDWQIQEIFDEDISALLQCKHYYVEVDSDNNQTNNTASRIGETSVVESTADFNFFKLPEIQLPTVKET